MKKEGSEFPRPWVKEYIPVSDCLWMSLSKKTGTAHTMGGGLCNKSPVSCL